MVQKKLIVAIDGVAASGKSTTAKIVAIKLGYLYLDSGALYRAVTLEALRKGVNLQDQRQVAKIADDIDIKLVPASDGTNVLIGGQEVTTAIRSPEVTENIGPVAANPLVRAAMVKRQRDFAKGGGVVADGRDIGTVVFPNAEVKFFFTASLTERTKRRAKEYEDQDIPKDLGQLAGELRTRDENDSTRSHGPLVKAQGAVEVDTSQLTIDEQVAIVLQEINAKLKST